MEKEKNIFDKFKPREKPDLAANYFSALEKELNTKVEFSSRPKKTKWKLQFYSAASIAAILLLLFNININGESNTTIVKLDNLKDVEINDYIEENIAEFDDDLFLEVGFISASETESSLTISDIETNELEDYLSDDNYWELNEY